MQKTNNEFENFDALVRRVFSVPHEEIVKREKEYKRKRKQAKKRKTRNDGQSRS
jgi:hypothetical protein